MNRLWTWHCVKWKLSAFLPFLLCRFSYSPKASVSEDNPPSTPPPPISMSSLTVKADNLLLIAATPSRPTHDGNHTFRHQKVTISQVLQIPTDTQTDGQSLWVKAPTGCWGWSTGTTRLVDEARWQQLLLLHVLTGGGARAGGGEGGWVVRGGRHREG